VTSIRARLTVAYAAALIGTMGAFALALWSSRRAGGHAEVERYVATEANLALNLIQQAEQAGQPVTEVKDTVVGALISPTLRSLLEGVPDYLMVLDASGRYLYLSFEARQLSSDDLTTLRESALAAPTDGVADLVSVGGEQLILAARTPAPSPSGSTSAISRVVVAASTRTNEVQLSQLVASMLIIGPVLLIASILLAYMIAGRALQPLDRMVDELQAITDGRSLHRRLPQDAASDEIERLAVTLNEMMGRLEKSFAALRRFTADASHELKTPLAVLRADVERAMSERTSVSDRMVALEESLQETTRMADLVDSLLTLARADEGRSDLHREPVQLEPIVRDVFETTSILGEPAGLAVAMSDLQPALVLGDTTRLRQLFLNLCTNAIKYTPRGGSVEISLARHGRTAAFTVRDSGIGISAADLPHVFERFFRADQARSRSAERGGFGLGLAISQWIAEAHGGTISVRSRLGRGTTFTVTLPIAEAEEVVVEARGNEEARRPDAPVSQS